MDFFFSSRQHGPVGQQVMFSRFTFHKPSTFQGAGYRGVNNCLKIHLIFPLLITQLVMLCDAWFSELKNIFSAVQYCRFSGLSRLIERTFYAKPWFYTITIHYNNRSFGITIHYYNRYNKDFLYHYCVLWYFFISFALFEGKQIHSFFSPVRLKPATQP